MGSAFLLYICCMAYSYEDLEKQAVEAIEENNLFFIADVIAYLPCVSSTFYSFELEKSEAIKEALTKVKVTTKVAMRSKWYKSDNPVLQMGLMKLISTDEELRKLAMQQIESNVKHELNFDIHTLYGSDKEA